MSTRSSRRPGGLAAGLVISLLMSMSVGVAPPAAADTFLVTNGNDAGPGSFRQAVTDASADTVGPVVIDFEPGLSVVLTSGVPSYEGDLDLTINGNGASIDATGTSGILESQARPVAITANNLNFRRGASFMGSAINAFGDVRVSNSTFEGNDTGLGGGGAIRSGANVSIINSTFTANIAGGDGGAVLASGDVDVSDSVFLSNRTSDDVGGAIAGFGKVSVTGSTFEGNTVAGVGGAIGGGEVKVNGSTFSSNTTVGREDGAGGAGGAIYAISDLSATNSTFSTNRSSEDGGAIHAVGEALLTYTTVAANSAPDGANVQAAKLTSFGSVVTGPSGGTNCSLSGTPTSSYSYDDDGSCGFTSTGDTSAGADPALRELDENGGPTATRLPEASSPLRDAIPLDACHPLLTTDQRGVARPQGPGCDIGAVEVEVFEPDPNSGRPDPEPPDPSATGGGTTPEGGVTPQLDTTPRAPASQATPSPGPSNPSLARTGWSSVTSLAVALWLVSLGAALVVWTTERKMSA